MPIPVQCRFQRDRNLRQKKEALMKTDHVLTVDEYLDECCVAPKHISPPAGNARHIAITTLNHVDPEAASHGSRCDRWGHPCPNGHTQKSEVVPQSSSNEAT
jgi:hypothetical protein